jgi:hypothetical protein
MLLYYYTLWHYTRAPKEYLGVWVNFMWFVLHVFSIPILLRTLFDPFQRLSERYSGGLHLDKLAEVIIVSLIMRIVGFCIRSILIIIGLVFLILTFSLGLLLFVVWFFIPIIIPGLVALGVAISVM